MVRLPIPGSDNGKWGELLNEYLKVSLDESGLIKPEVLSHKLNVADIDNSVSFFVQDTSSQTSQAIDSLVLNTVMLHSDRTDNPHGVTKQQIGLSAVDNVSAADLRNRQTHTGPLPATRIYKTYEEGTQTIVSSAISNVTTSGIEFNIGVGLTTSSGAVTVSSAGLYMVDAQVQFLNGSAGARTILLRKITGGVTTTVREFGAGTDATTARVTGSTTLLLASGDTIVLSVYVNGTAPTLSTGSLNNSKDIGMTVVKIADAS